MKNKTDKPIKPKESTGALFYLLSGLAVSVVAPALLSFAGFLIFIPWLNIAAAVVLTPALCAFLYMLFYKKTRMELMLGRIMTGVLSVIGAYLFICVMAGVLSGVFGTWPLESAEMNEIEMTELLSLAPKALGKSLSYLISFGRLWQDLAAWNGGGWLVLAVAALTAQIGLPQLLIKKAGGSSYEANL